MRLRDEIGAMLERKALKPGDRAPTEAELAAQFRILTRCAKR